MSILALIHLFLDSQIWMYYIKVSYCRTGYFDWVHSLWDWKGMFFYKICTYISAYIFTMQKIIIFVTLERTLPFFITLRPQKLPLESTSRFLVISYVCCNHNGLAFLLMGEKHDYIFSQNRIKFRYSKKATILFDVT